MKTPGYYLTYDEDKITGPIAPDNPKWEFTDPRMLFKCKAFAKEMNKKFKTNYEVLRVDS